MSEALELPLASINRIVKAALPAGATVSKEVKQSLGKAAALFILYLSHTANDVCKTHKRSTVNGEDVMAAVEEIEFDMFIEPLQAYLKEFREEASKKRAKPKGDAGGGEGGAAAPAAPGEKKRRGAPTKDKSAAGTSAAAAAAGASDSAAAAAPDSDAKRARIANDEQQQQQPASAAASEAGGMEEEQPESRQASEGEDDGEQ